VRAIEQGRLARTGYTALLGVLTPGRINPMKRAESFLLIAIVSLLLAIKAPNARAAGDKMDGQGESDWGYEGYPSNTSQAWKKSPGASGSRSESTAGLTPLQPEPVKGMSAKAMSGQWESAKGSVPQSKQFSDLLQFFELAAMHSLSPDQKQDLKAFLPAAQKDGPGNGWDKLSAFMSQVQERVEQDSKEAEDFGQLFRALLRLTCSSNSLPKPQITIIENILGPARLAVEGTPSLSEEAVNSYADMACFMYEKKNPGKTVDADDNRLVFAHVIKDKFNDAPSEKDKRAMANFALTWYKFKVSYDVASKEEKALLVQSLDERKSLAKNSPNSLTAKIFANGPWHNLFAAAPVNKKL
jgi:hypothetical protein